MSEIQTYADAQVFLGIVEEAGEPRDMSDEHLGKEQEFDEKRYPKAQYLTKPYGDPQGPEKEIQAVATKETAEMLADRLGLELKYYTRGSDQIPVLVAPNGFQIHAGYTGTTWNSACEGYRIQIEQRWNPVGRLSRANITDPQQMTPEIVTLRWIAQEAERQEPSAWPKYVT